MYRGIKSIDAPPWDEIEIVRWRVSSQIIKIIEARRNPPTRVVSSLTRYPQTPQKTQTPIRIKSQSLPLYFSSIELMSSKKMPVANDCFPQKPGSFN